MLIFISLVLGQWVLPKNYIVCETSFTNLKSTKFSTVIWNWMATPSFLKKWMFTDFFNFWCMFCSYSTKEFGCLTKRWFRLHLHAELVQLLWGSSHSKSSFDRTYIAKVVFFKMSMVWDLKYSSLIKILWHFQKNICPGHLTRCQVKSLRHGQLPFHFSFFP